MISAFQLPVIRIGLDLEIKTWDGSRMQMTRESSLHALTRLLGVPTTYFGRGKSGRIAARQWVHETEVMNDMVKCDDVACSCKRLDPADFVSQEEAF